jgi:hypothetical protein
MSENQKEIEDFKKILLEVMDTMDNAKECTEKDFRKAYHAIRKENVNVMVDKLDKKNKAFCFFLRYHCRDIFEVYQREKHGEVKILRLEDAMLKPSPKSEKKKQKHKKNTSAPKLK